LRKSPHVAAEVDAAELERNKAVAPN
jgi:hypothetical protein